MAQSAPEEELVGFLSSPRQEIRMIACNALVGYSTGSQTSIFKPPGLKPIKDLKILLRDHPAISENAATILVNVSDDREVLNLLADDHSFLELLFTLITNPSYPGADCIAMLLANMAKHESIPAKILKLKREKPKPEWNVSDSGNAMDQLMDLFVKGSEKKLNTNANFDYLAYLFADISGHTEGRKYFVQEQAYDNVIPLTKLIVFTEHNSDIRRKGVASTIKNALFNIESHPTLMSESSVNLLPYILLPLMGSEEYPDKESLSMPNEVQLLPPDKERECDKSIIATHLESIVLLGTTREMRDLMRELQVYPIIREVHLAEEDDEIRKICEQIVNVLKRDEADETSGDRLRIEELNDDDDGIVDLA